MKNAVFSLLALGPIVTVQAHAEIYMTEEKAATSIFPGLTFERSKLNLDKDVAKAIERDSGETVRSPSLTVFKTKNKDVVFIDQVLGKHEFITFAVGISGNGEVRGVEILEYRESYGSQVREEDWKKQFIGKTKAAPMKVDKDVKGISGATLSSVHVTAGVRRLVHTYDHVKVQL